MVIENDRRWAKLAFEATDFGTTAVVCVVTDGVSDDANGCDLAQSSVWLKVVRAGNVFSTHYSLDGEHYRMVRMFRLPVPAAVRIGLAVRSPTGKGGDGLFEEVCLENKTVANLRAGI